MNKAHKAVAFRLVRLWVANHLAVSIQTMFITFSGFSLYEQYHRQSSCDHIYNWINNNNSITVAINTMTVFCTAYRIYYSIP